MDKHLKYTKVTKTPEIDVRIVALKARIGADAWMCINVFRTSDGRRCMQQSFWEEWRRVSQGHTNWWALLFYNNDLDRQNSSIIALLRTQ